jgi:type IV pilus assembly protein PilB
MKVLDILQDEQFVISNDLANQYRVLPKVRNSDSLVFYADEQCDLSQITDELSLILDQKITLEPRSSLEIDLSLSVHYRIERKDVANQNFNLNDIDFLEKLILEAQSLKSSDIHFEIYEQVARIRFRIDGQLIERYNLSKDSYLELVNKIKIRAKLNITEKRLPQDGRITSDLMDIRVSILPTLFGEKIVLRLLGQDASNISLLSLGFDEEVLSFYMQAIKKSNGIILISGPTGSGKTTTLYATLRELNKTSRNILTVEDPIEYTLKGINQVQLKEDIGLSFATALKSFLRQDPDVIMLGEIRDSETAIMAVRASLTGHLVLSTIHTNSALGTISRLIDMGVPSYLIAETLNISVAQRLVRKLCNDCKKKQVVEKQNFPKNFIFPFEITETYKAVGCNNCYHTGYSGRQAIYEVLRITEDVVDLIKQNDLNSLNKNYKTLSTIAFNLLSEGVTSLDEIYPILIQN